MTPPDTSRLDGSGFALEAARAARNGLHAYALKVGTTEGLTTVFADINGAITALERSCEAVPPGFTVGTRPCWVATCVTCGEGDSEDGQSYHYLSLDEAKDALHGVDWREIPGGGWECFDCWDAKGGHSA